MNATKPLPIMVVDSDLIRRRQVIACFSEHDLLCTDDQAAALIACIPTLRQLDDEMWETLRDFVIADPECASPEFQNEQLKGLRDRYLAAEGAQKEQLEQLILAATDGMVTCPHWWDCPCLCDECRSLS